MLQITKEDFLKGVPFYLIGEPNKIYQFFPEPQEYGKGFIAQHYQHKADVIEITDISFSFRSEIIGSYIVSYIPFERCLNYMKSLKDPF